MFLIFIRNKKVRKFLGGLTTAGGGETLIHKFVNRLSIQNRHKFKGQLIDFDSENRMKWDNGYFTAAAQLCTERHRVRFLLSRHLHKHTRCHMRPQNQALFDKNSDQYWQKKPRQNSTT